MLLVYGKTRAVEDGMGELMAIYVLPNQAGKGIGTLLLKNAEKGLKYLGYSHFVLWMLVQNKPAIKFYEAHGWQYNGKQQKKIILNRKVKLLQYEKIIISDK
ncbi:GNAT family N-acetyltransferase [Limosilactobacillus sp. BG-MG3-A]|uniref:GNAT family N-acetyltransferase n=1 Tax=Limosilactobacillus agrestis TaxID=2759748 RepID=A0A7W3YLQ5_9LACO|nr:GNAT family N-acetyltransferase [Limosilactobacillus agrestis]MBB1095507.1 GNAT family N-acetyltransferase [Limosilactobacillus agrestis]MBB1098754.1 GNAT family N-acetyltransferase [Limosilactobacillus agrestis]MCD7125719.1 GNAT family N-acetyltransferase [Limosilactobacillus agrestis]